MKYIKNIFTFFAFIFIAPSLFAQTTKLSPALQKQIENSKLSEYLVWIYFTDKGDDIQNRITNLEYNLPMNARERRAKVFPPGELVSEDDLLPDADYVSALNPYLIQVRRESRWLNAVSADISSENIANIEALEFVERIDIVMTLSSSKKTERNFVPITRDVFTPINAYDFIYGESFWQNDLIQVPEMHNLGYSGSGITVAIFDTGFNNLSHEAFAQSDIIAAYDFVNNDENVADEDDMGYGGHGTNTLSTLGGFKEGELVGPAFGASFILGKTENTDSETQIEEDNWVAAIEWSEFMPGGGPDIASTSLGYSNYDDGTTYEAGDLDGNTTVITRVSDIAASKGILVLNSAGNNGSLPTTISAPADGDSVLAVGAVDEYGEITGFSSRGPSGDGRIKPDVSAPGSWVYAAGVNGNEYTYTSGTSFSCPITAGAAALLWEAFPQASNMDIFEALRMTATQADNPNNDYGYGIIQVKDAYDYLDSQFAAENLPSAENFLYPNPANEFVYCGKNFFSGSYEIRDINGRLLKTGTVKSQKIDLSDIENNGLLFIRLLGENFRQTFKVLKLK